RKSRIMNKIYKLKYDRRRQQLVAVSELTTGAGKETTGQVCGLPDISSFRKLLGTLTPLALVTGLVMSLLPGMALANPALPTGGQIVAGQGSISSSGNQMTVNQNTQGMVANWNSFDIGKNHTVQFVQPGSSSVVLNRVTGGHESQILGTLTANGRVMLINPAGVMFGQGSKVNTAGLVASTKNISNQDFMAGRYTFSGGSNPGAEIVNQGSLTTTKGGYIVLAADRVRNEGEIRTPGGRVVLAAADRVTLQLDNSGLTAVSVNGNVVNALVENRGLISATNGRVYLTARGKDMLLNTVVNNSGTVEAKGLSERGGDIVLDGGDSGVVTQSGRLLADSDSGRGGKITLEGQNIHLAGGSLISATGENGGGEVYVGGGWQGKDSGIRHASKVVMDKNAVIDVSAKARGQGGTAVLWSDDYTNFRGTILARGGLQGGDGGRVETSSHHNLQAFGDVDASAVKGNAGEWLLDPFDVTVVQGSTDANADETAGTWTPHGLSSSVGADTINQRLNAGTNVTIKTASDLQNATQGGSITVNADISKISGADTTLTLEADKDITINGVISATTGKLNLTLQGAGSSDGKVDIKKAVSLNSGDFKVQRAKNSNYALLFSSNQNITAHDISIEGFSNAGSTNAVKIYGGKLDATGAINITGNGTGEADKTIYLLNTVLNGSAINLTASSEKWVGIVAENATLNATNDIVLNGSSQESPGIKLMKGSKLTSTGGNVSLTGANTKGAGNKEGILMDGGSITAAQSISLNGATTGSGNSIGVNVSNAATLTATSGSITVTGSSSRESGAGVSLTSATLTANSGCISVTGTGFDSSNGGLLVNGSTFSALKTVLEGTASRNNVGAKLTGNINVTQGDLSVTGTAKQFGDGSFTGLQADSGLNLNVSAGNLTLIGKIDKYEGKTGLSGSTGLNLNGATLSANHADLKGSNVFSGKGFVLSNVTLVGNLANAANMTFSSEGSGTGVSNALDIAGGMNLTTFNTLSDKGIENDTLVSGISVSEDELKQDLHFAGNTSDWSFNGSDLSKASGGKSGKWMVGGLSGVNASTTGNIALTGVNLVDGNLTGRSVSLTGAAGTPLTVTNTSLNATAGDVILNNTRGVVGVTNSNLTATGGNISITGARVSGTTPAGVSVRGGELNASGNINITGSGVEYWSDDSVVLADTKLKADAISLAGSKGGNGAHGLHLSNASLTAEHDIVLNGRAGADPLLIEKNSVLNSTNGAVNITGTTTNVRAAGWALTVRSSNISAATGINLYGDFRGGDDNGVMLDSADMTVSAGNISVSGINHQITGASKAGDGVLHVKNSNFSALNTELNGTSFSGATSTVLEGNINVTQGNLTVNGEVHRRGTGGHAGIKGVKGLNLTVTSGELNLNGSVEKSGGNDPSKGIELNDATLSANKATLVGTNAEAGSGFVLNNVSLKEGIANGTNATFSSAGSAETVTNVIGKNTLNATTAQVLMNTGIENFTQIDGSLVTEANDTSSDDWVKDYTSSKGGGWIFDGVTVNKTGNISLTGAGFTNSTVTAGQNLSLNATNTTLKVADSTLKANAGNISLSTATETLTVSNVTLESGGGEVTLSGTSAKEAGVKLMNTVNVTKGNLTVNGTSTGKGGRGIDARGATLNVSESDKKLTMNGHVDNGTGIDLSGSSSLNATNATLNGTASGTGSGFLLNSTLNGGLVNNGALVLKSTGSGENVVNQIGTAVNTTVVKHMIETNTSIGSYTDVLTVNLYEKNDFDTWKNGSSNLTKDFGDFGLRFSNMTVSADSINLSGASFTDSSLTATSGDLTINNKAGAVGLVNTSLNASAGNVTLTGNAGISLSGISAGIDAGKDISLKASAGKVDIAGNYKTEKKVTSLDKPVNITSTGGNISVVATNPQEGDVTAVNLKGVNLNASAGGISMNGTVPKGGLHSFGVNLQDVTFKTKNNITVDADSSGIAVRGGNVSMDAGDSLLVNGKGKSSGWSYAAVPFTNSTFKANNTIAFEAVDSNEAGAQVQSALGFYGDTKFEAKQTSLKGSHQNPGKNTSFTSTGVALTGPEPCCNNNKGSVNVIGDFSVDGNVNDSGAGVVIGADLNVSGKTDIKGHSQSGQGVAFTTSVDDGNPARKVELNISAGGGGSIAGTSVSGTGMMLQNKDDVVNVSTGSDQKLVLGGESSTGPGVALGGHISRVPQQDGPNAGDGGTVVFSGKSLEGNGVNIPGGTKLMQLLVNGESAGSGNGIDLAKSAGVEGGALDGLSQKGAGVKVGGDNTLTDVTVNGSTTDGTGVDITGNLTNTGNTTVNGTATGTGTGVDLAGNVTGGSVNGSATEGTGVNVSDSTLNNVAVSGSTTDGTGVDITGNLTNTGNTTVNGTATGTGTGVDLAGNISGGIVSGSSQGGNGVRIAGGTKLTQVMVNGKGAGNGNGILVAGFLQNIMAALNGTTAGTGNGIELAKSAGVEGGKLDGFSQKGAGVKVGGDSTLSNVTLNGSSNSGTGVDITGSLTNKDNTTLTGNSVSGAGVGLNGTVTGGSLTGNSVSGPGMHVTGNSVLNGVEVNTSSQSGPAMNVDGMLSTAGGTTLNGEVQKESAEVRRQVYELQRRLSRPDTVQDAWHSSGYRAPEKPVSVEICTADGQCRTLNAGETDTPQSR
ncbi:filamentous hemagglutinin N-terminal domain-containing protein, partial [Salmonella enterica subsp. diarizonae]|nr:filamentous hemagglutinin N-terminal domain-containing protein [Salmonella enterica subsp. diarizonae]